MGKAEKHSFGSEKEQMKLLHDISSLFTLGPKLEKILHILLDRIGKRIDVTYLAVWLINKDGFFDLVSSYRMSKKYIAYTKTKEGRLKKDEGVVGEAYTSKKPVLVRDFNDGDFVPRRYVNFIKSMGIHMAGLICFPLIAKNQVIGTLNFYFPKPRKSMPDSEINYISIIANQMAGFIQNSRIYEELKEEENKIASIISNFLDPVIVVDQQGRIDLVNPEMQKVFKLTASSLGRKVAGENGEFSFEALKKIAKTDFKFSSSPVDGKQKAAGEEIVVIPSKNKTGGRNPFAPLDSENADRVFKIRTASVRDKEKNYGIMKIFNDLTREKLIDKMKSEFISIAAHQLRTPLSSIKWVINMFLSGDVGILSKEQKDLLQKGYQSNERIIALVNDMLNVSRIEEGRFGYDFKKIDFNEILSVVLPAVEKNIDANNIKLTVDKPASLPLVRLDKEKMILVMENLLENAVKYTLPNGLITLKVAPVKSRLEVSVADNGVGIPIKDRAKLFTKFFRASNVVRLQTDGSGLGLFIVKNIVEGHGGRITCRSKEGAGSEFVFTVPLDDK